MGRWARRMARWAGAASERPAGPPLPSIAGADLVGFDVTRGPRPNLAIVAIIPARFASTRLPGKPLSEINGKTLIERVHERVRAARRPDRVIVATDDERIAAVVRRFGGEAMLTSLSHATGTDRIAEVARSLDAEIVVDVQGDEPMLDPTGIDIAVEALLADPTLPMATLAAPFTSADEMLAPAVVKVVTDEAANALYFSRAPIPHVRLGGSDEPRRSAEQAVARGLARRHVGLYAFRRDALLRFASLPPCPLERAEALEQLRALHYGIRIRVLTVTGEESIAVDTPEDLERVRAALRSERGRTA